MTRRFDATSRYDFATAAAVSGWQFTGLGIGAHSSSSLIIAGVIAWLLHRLFASHCLVLLFSPHLIVVSSPLPTLFSFPFFFSCHREVCVFISILFFSLSSLFSYLFLFS